MNLYQQLILQAPDIDCVLAITSIRPNARWNNNALIEETFVDPDHANALPSVQEIVVSWNAIKAARAQASANVDAYNTALSQGYDTGYGFKMSITETSFNIVNSALTLFKLAADVNLMNDASMVDVVDQNDTIRYITFAQFKAMLLPFGMACKNAYRLKPR